MTAEHWWCLEHGCVATGRTDADAARHTKATSHPTATSLRPRTTEERRDA